MLDRIYRFIIVDDDEDLRLLIRRTILRKYPRAEISEAHNGPEALELFERAGADLMVIGHDSRLLSGVELVRELRRRNVVIPLIMACDLADSREEAMAAGATFFMDKRTLSATLVYFLPAFVTGGK